MMNKDEQKKEKAKSQSRTEELLDESLDESFPASDPPTLTRVPSEKEPAKPASSKTNPDPRKKSAVDYSI